ncbi:MAG: hypothetical protein M0R66_01290 [Candidatus Omnitrophica bacterium]|nr:hypothetical protein [Candidatus Omnitrophota bacterium]
MVVKGDFTAEGTFTFGDAAVDTLILKGRVATGTAGGSNILVDASYTYGELWEARSRVTSWSGVGNSFTGHYFRTEAGVASSGKGLRTIEAYCVANATFSVDQIECAYFEAAMKASGTQTIARAYAVEAALAPYGGSGAITISDKWACVLLTPSGVSSRIDATNAAKIHGIYLLARDGDGGSTKLGDGFYLGNDSGQAGTRTLTNGVNMAIGATTGILLAGATTTGVSITGSATDAIKIQTGTFTDAIEIAGTTTNGVNISGAVTKGVLIAGNATDAVYIGGGTVVDAIEIAACTNAINVSGNTTTGVLLAGASSADGISITGVCADAIHVSGANTATGLHISGNQVDHILLDVDAAADNGLKILVDDGITVGTGINIDRTGTTGVCTTGISIDTDGTTGVSLAAGFTGVTGFEVAGTCSGSAVSITGACATGLSSTGASALISASATLASQTAENKYVDLGFATDSTYLAGTNITYSGGIGSSALKITGTWTGASGGYSNIYSYVTASTDFASDNDGVVNIKAVTLSDGVAVTDGNLYGGQFISKKSGAGVATAQAAFIGVESWFMETGSGEVRTGIGGNFGFHADSSAASHAAGSVWRGLQVFCDSAGTSQAEETTAAYLWAQAGTINNGLVVGAGTFEKGVSFIGTTTTGISFTGTTTTAISIGGTVTTGVSVSGIAEKGKAISVTGGATKNKGVFVGADADAAGSGLHLNGGDWDTAQGNGFYCDDGGEALTGYTECLTARMLMTANVASGDVSTAAMHPDLTINADYTGVGGLSAIWGNTTIKTGKAVDVSGSLGDVGGATFGLDVVGTLATNSHGCGVSVGLGGSGTKNGIVTGFRVRTPTGTVLWDGFASIPSDGTTLAAMTATGSSNGTLTNCPHNGDPAYWLKVYVGTTAFCVPLFATS